MSLGSNIFKAALALTTLQGVDAKVAHVKDMRSETGASDLINNGKKVDIYGFWGYEYMKSNISNPTDDSLDFRFEVAFNMDIGVGYEILLFWILREGKNLLVLNPNAFIELSTRNEMKFKLGIIEWIINVDLTGYRITPLDY